jgi:hypothetical protein
MAVNLTGYERPVCPIKFSAAVALWVCIHTIPVSNRTVVSHADWCLSWFSAVRQYMCPLICIKCHNAFLLNPLQINSHELPCVFKTSVMWYCVARLMFTGVSENPNAFNFKSVLLRNLKIKTARFSKHRVTQTQRHGVTALKILFLSNTDVRTSNIANVNWTLCLKTP